VKAIPTSSPGISNPERYDDHDGDPVREPTWSGLQLLHLRRLLSVLRLLFIGPIVLHDVPG
jgi:hypothetical protein